VTLFFVHEIHALDASGAAGFEQSVRDDLVPAIATDASTRLVWCARSMPGSAAFPELITMTAVADGAALERLADRYRTGDLRELSIGIDRHRQDRTVRVLAALEEFNPYSVDLDDVPLVRDDAPTEMYIHDWVVPQPGMQRIYEVQMREAFMKMLEIEALPMKTWGGFETVAGGGRVPLSLMITHIANPAAIANLVSEGNPRVTPEPGSWMREGLKLRDTWISRLVRSVRWSPTS
jgi:hypothetical protein